MRSQVIYVLHMRVRMSSNGNRYKTIVPLPLCLLFLLFGLDRSKLEPPIY